MLPKKGFEVFVAVVTVAAMLAVAGCGGGGGAVSSGNPAAVIPASALQVVSPPAPKAPPRQSAAQEPPETEPVEPPEIEPGGPFTPEPTLPEFPRIYGAADSRMMPDVNNGRHYGGSLPGWVSQEAQLREWSAAAKDASSNEALFARDTVRQSSRYHQIAVRTDASTSFFGDLYPRDDGVNVYLTGAGGYALANTTVGRWRGNGVKPRPRTGDDVRYTVYAPTAHRNDKPHGLVGMAFTDRKPMKLAPGWEPPENGDTFSGYGLWEPPELNYLAYGIWMLALGDDATTKHEVGVTVSGAPIGFHNLRVASGTAQYTGGFTGLYFKEQTGRKSEIIPLTGEARLTANFSLNNSSDINADGLAVHGTIHGELSDIQDGRGRENFRFNVDGTGIENVGGAGNGLFGLPEKFILEKAEIVEYPTFRGGPNTYDDPEGHRIRGTVRANVELGNVFTGKWGGKFFGGPGPMGDKPGRVGGTFAAHASAKIGEVTGRSVIGVFGARR